MASDQDIHTLLVELSIAIRESIQSIARMDAVITLLCHAVIPVTEQDQLPDPNEVTTHTSSTHNTPSPADEPDNDTDSQADTDTDTDLDRRMERLREASLHQVRQKADEKKNT